VLDDFGLMKTKPPGHEDLYEVIDARYEQGSILITSNRDRAEWPDMFGEPLLASAALDRLIHNARMLEITGRSFRAAQTDTQTTNQRDKGKKDTEK
jgi:DNA replication protein DnaC